jgi:hypothetical protein
MPRPETYPLLDGSARCQSRRTSSRGSVPTTPTCGARRRKGGVVPPPRLSKWPPSEFARDFCTESPQRFQRYIFVLERFDSVGRRQGNRADDVVVPIITGSLLSRLSSRRQRIAHAARNGGKYAAQPGYLVAETGVN